MLEGPQGTLFGGGAEAGAVRYITNKPKLNVFEGNAEAGYGLTADGAPNASGNVTVNLPVITDKVAVRITAYDEHQGGYIDNVPATFTRNNADPGNFYFGIPPTGGQMPERRRRAGERLLHAFPTQHGEQPVAGEEELQSRRPTRACAPR